MYPASSKGEVSSSTTFWVSGKLSLCLATAGADKSRKPLEIRAFRQKESAAILIPIVSKLRCFFGGPGGIRTLDLSDANRTLSQLSYRPIYLQQYLLYHTPKQITSENFSFLGKSVLILHCLPEKTML